MSDIKDAHIGRNITGHGLTAAALTAFIWVLTRVDGWFGHHAAVSLPAARIVALLWHVTPPMLALILLAAFIIPKKDGHLYGGQVHGAVRYTHDDPWHLVWPSRLAGAAIVLVAGYIWGDAIVAALRAWVG